MHGVSICNFFRKEPLEVVSEQCIYFAYSYLIFCFTIFRCIFNLKARVMYNFMIAAAIFLPSSGNDMHHCPLQVYLHNLVTSNTFTLHNRRWVEPHAGRLLAAYSQSSAARFVGDIACPFLSSSKYSNSTLSWFQDEV